MSAYSFPSSHGDVRFDAQDLARIGAGAVSDVHRLRVPGHGDIAVKLYKDPVSVDWERVRRLVELGERLDRPGIDGPAAIAFPRAVVHRGHVPVGICLPLFPQPENISLDSWTEAPLLKRLGENLDNLTIKMTIVTNLAEAISHLHAHDIAVVDLKPANILVDTSTMRLAILDTDSFGFIDEAGRKFRPTHVSAGYIDPRGYSGELDVGSLWQDQDLYALAVIAFQLLNNGVHPYQCAATGGDELPPTNDEKAKAALYAYGLSSREGIAPVAVSVHETWPAGIRQLFDRAFIPGKARPSAAEWRAEIRGILDGRELARCSRFPKDPRHIHFMGQTCSRCALVAARAHNDVRAQQRRQAAATSRPSGRAPIGRPPAKKTPWEMYFLFGLVLLLVIAVLAR
jgi:DNA-binding helix-hairpin-helix protein with protein kinase domain